MLTTSEIARVVIFRSKLERPVKMDFLMRRAIKSQHVYTKREYRVLRRQFHKVINACVADLNTFITNGGIPQAEANYYNRKGEATVDMIFNNVQERLFEHMLEQNFPPQPPQVRRTCTGYFGPRCTPDEVAFKEWEE